VIWLFLARSTSHPVAAQSDCTNIPLAAGSRDNKQVHGGKVWSMIAQEGSPSLAWRPASLDHVLGDARLSDLKPSLNSSP
jgi:hypothetical protein